MLLLAACLVVAGCHSPYVSATIANHSAAPLRLVEVDYPSASFGTGNLAAGAQFHYRFKIQGASPIKIQFTDEQGKQHEATGPELRQGQEGQLTINIDSNNAVSWQADFLAQLR